MTSGKKARQQRRTPPPPVRSTGGRKASPKVLAIAGAVIVLAGIAVAAAVALTGGSSSSTTTPTPLPDSGTAVSLLKGIPEHGNVLGSPKAPVTMTEYIDLQCSSCQVFETQNMPSIIRKYVRTGKVKVEARPIVLIGPDSELGVRATTAAGQQNAFFTLAQILYYNQGPENGGWLKEQTVLNAASGIPGFDVARLKNALNSSAVTSLANRYTSEANADKVNGTPTVYVAKGSGPRVQVAPGLIPSADQLSAAIDKAPGQ